MVSLTRSFNTNSGGATFFSESLNMEDTALLQPIFDSYGIFKPLRTVPVFSFHLLFTVALDILAIVYAVRHPDEKSKCREYFIIIYLHVGLWFFTLIMDQITRCKHHNLRLNGYLEFYQKTKIHASLPFYITSLWSVALLLIQALMQHFYPDDFVQKCINGGIMSPVSYLAVLLTLEVGVVSAVHGSYIVKVNRFNKQKPAPDVQREEWISCANPDSINPNEVGYKQLGDRVVDLLEKQADLIRYLREHNARLGERLMTLGAQLHLTRGQHGKESQQQQTQHPQEQTEHPQEESLPSTGQPIAIEEQQQSAGPSPSSIVEIHPDPSQVTNGQP